ncbi:hypothetical protein PLICRDRAFT_55312 [Plicaturopsis crispa FD-325 SS-3]|nr:hypothetical protein PLICRDRAFT_55312 [Plicaturopsis crispa FD-325 SS-3]
MLFKPLILAAAVAGVVSAEEHSQSRQPGPPGTRTFTATKVYNTVVPYPPYLTQVTETTTWTQVPPSGSPK